MKKIVTDNFYSQRSLKKFNFKKVGSNVKISKNSLIIGHENISLGSDIRIDAFSTIIANRGKLKLENKVHIGSHSHLLASGGISIGSNCTISQGVKIYSQSDDYSGKKPAGLFLKKKISNYIKAKVEIENYVIVGSGSVILPGVKITQGCSIGALSLVNKSLKSLGIYAGIPCKKIKKKYKNYF